MGAAGKCGRAPVEHDPHTKARAYRQRVRKRKPDPRTSNGTARKKMRARVRAEESVCWICKQPVDTSLPAGLPLSPEVDEIVPVSLGGDPFDRSNCRLAHRICNQRRGNKLHSLPPVTQMACVTTEDW